MKQIVQSFRTGTVQVEDVPAPLVKHGTILVRNKFSLVSAGTERLLLELGQKSLIGKARARPDLVSRVMGKMRSEGVMAATKTVLTRLNQPVAIGYSSAGIVEEVGKDVDRFNVGDRVACAGAGHAVHAEIVRVPRNLAAGIPAAVDFSAAAFTTLGAISLHAFRISDAKLGETVAVLGMGLVGLLTVQVAKAAGCTVLGMDLDSSRCRIARTMGCDAVCVSEGELRRLVRDHGAAGADAVIICASTSKSELIRLAGEIARDRATVVVVGAVGMDLPRQPYYEKELTLRVSRSYGPGRYDPGFEEKGLDYPPGYVRWTETRNMEAFLDLVGAGKVMLDPLISHRFPVEDARRAYELLSREDRGAFLGILIEYPGGSETSRRLDLGGTRALPPIGSSSTARLAVGFLGAGNFARGVLLPELKKLPGAELHGICSATGLSAQHVGRQHGFRYCTADSQEILDDPRINVVVIATPHGEHASLTVRALEAGKHVFCEKPLALTPRELSEVAGTGVKRSPGQILMVGYNRRFAGLVDHLKRFLGSRKGTPLMAHYRINAGFVPLDSWVQDPEMGGGRILGEVCHFVDLLSFLVGEAPVRVFSKALPNRDRYRDDNLCVLLEYGEGSLATITYAANGDRSYPKERLEIFVDGSVAVLDDFRSLELTREGRRQSRKVRFGRDKGHAAEWKAFAASLAGGVPAISVEDLVITSLTTFRILDSLRCGQPVDVDPTPFLAPAGGGKRID